MPQSKIKVPHLFRDWPKISERIRSAAQIRLFLDFDGTLVPYCFFPNDVKLPEAVRRDLVSLVRNPRVHVALVSGRRNSTLRKFVRVSQIQLLGLYGWEGKNGVVLSARARKALPRLRSILKWLPSEIPGIRVEDKGVAFAIHFRGATVRAVRQAQLWTRKLLTRIRGDFSIIRSHSAWEIVPRHVKGKGLALRKFTKKLSGPFLPIYVGDDLTDEPAFKVLRRGITIRVGAALPTYAHLRLRNAEELHIFLKRLEEALR